MGRAMGMYSQDELDSIYGDLNADACDFEDSNFRYSTETEWDNADAMQRGEENPEAAWVCTDRDVWHRNPYYKGPPVQHPENDGITHPPVRNRSFGPDYFDDDIPF